MTVKEIQSVIKSCQIPQGQDIKEDLGFILVRTSKMEASTDSNRNEVISTQQMCKTSTLFTKIVKFTLLTYSTVFY